MATEQFETMTPNNNNGKSSESINKETVFSSQSGSGSSSATDVSSVVLRDKSESTKDYIDCDDEDGGGVGLSGGVLGGDSGNKANSIKKSGDESNSNPTEPLSSTGTGSGGSESARGSGSNAEGSTTDESEAGIYSGSKETMSIDSEDGVFLFRNFVKSSQKSVCFHSLTSNLSEKKLTSPLECLQFMINGSTLIKIKSNTRQYRRYFTLEPDLSGIRWVPSSKKTSKAKLNIKSIKEVRPGKNTEVLKMKEVSGYSETCAFSLIFGEDFESLDLIANSPEEANIWVTGLNFLLGANKSTDAFESRQKMRERWLQEVFDEADPERKGLLDEWETIALMKKLNSQLCIKRLKQKIMEFEFGKDEEERGRISKTLFVTLFNETATRPDIYFILVRYCGKDYMNLEDLQMFLEGEQGACGMSLEECEQLINKFERSEEAKQRKQLLLDGFTQLLLSEENEIRSPVHKLVCQDMSHPLCHYFIATSHNTYLLEDQLKGPSSPDGYTKALLQGCRCVKIDCWDGPTGPVVFHGNTLTSKIPIEDVLEAINEHAFTVSEYPLIIHLENHCSIPGQKYVATLLRDTFGSSLYIPSEEKPCPVNCLQDLKGKVLIKGKKLPPKFGFPEGEVSDEDDAAETKQTKDALKRIPYSKELSDLTSLVRTHCFDLTIAQQLGQEIEVSYFNEAFASKLALACTEEFVHHNKSYLSQVAPDICRVDSSNVNPFDFWNCGVQLVSMNYQSPGQLMDYYRGWFQQNGSCGYVLKPAFLRERFCLFNARRKDSLPGIDPLRIRLKIISGQQLPRPKGASSKASAIDPYVTLQMAGVPTDCAEARTRTVFNEGHSPIFDESFEFSVTVPELAMLRFLVLDDDYINDDFIGQCTLPIECLQTGYRHVRLYANNGDHLPNATLFVHVSITHRYGVKQKLRRKRSWSSKQSTDLRSIGLKSVDDAFKASSTLISESVQLRKDIEKWMVELCDECSLQENANLAQCLRVFVLRLASCSTVNSFEIIKPTDQGIPTLKIEGEISVKLGKTEACLKKVLSEFFWLAKNAQITLEKLDEVHETIVKLGDELTTLCTTSGIKGRKADKVAENFMWNLSVLKTEMDILRAAKEDSECALIQVERLGEALKRLFEREKESFATSARQEPLKSVPVSTHINLEPELKQPPLTPTSPADKNLRGILKKSATCSNNLSGKSTPVSFATATAATVNQPGSQRGPNMDESGNESA